MAVRPKLENRNSLALHTGHASADVIYRFAGVEVDAAGRRLYVDGQERACSHRVFTLLLMLCEQPGRVYTRDELFAQLWPSSRFPADESLSQLIFRLRTVLGPYNSVVVTVRHVGLRLDAEVLQETPAVRLNDKPGQTEATSKTEGGENAGAAADEIASGRRVALRSIVRARPRLLGLLAVVALAIALAYGLWPTDREVDMGWGLRESDLMASRADTADTLREVFRLDTTGDRPKAQLLLEAVHEADPSTPVPAIFLGAWANVRGDAGAAGEWFSRARQRFTPDTPHYTRLIERYLRQETEYVDTPLKLASLLLKLRPEAWQLRQARTHHYLIRNQRTEALADLQRLRVTSLNSRLWALALADRASLGDVEGAEAALNALPEDPGNALYDYVRGRIQFTRGDYGAARASFDRSVAAAKRAEQPLMQLVNGEHAAMASAELGQWADVRERLHRLLALSLDENRNDFALEISLLLIGLPTITPEERKQEIQKLTVLMAQPGVYECVCIELVLGVFGESAPAALRCRLGDLPSGYEHRGLRELVGGFRALVDGDVPSARAQLDASRREGVGETTLAAFADALAARLGEKVRLPPPPDPPYPYWIRFVVRWQLQAALAAKPLSPK